MRSEPVWREHDVTFAAHHPATEGHFPGHPIVPGALLLDEVVAAIARARAPDAGLRRIRTAKFLHPVRPGARMTVRWAETDMGVTFECWSEARRVLSGAGAWGGAP